MVFFCLVTFHPAPTSSLQKQVENIPKGNNMSEKTFTEAVLQFIRTSSWLSDVDEPAVVALLAMAAELDQTMTPALLAQYGLTYRNLLSRAPQAADDQDELAKLLKR